MVVARTNTGDDIDTKADACADRGVEVDDLVCEDEALAEAPACEDARIGNKGVLRTFEVAAEEPAEASARRQLAVYTERSTGLHAVVEGKFGVSTTWLSACDRSGLQAMDIDEPEVSACSEGIHFGECACEELRFQRAVARDNGREGVFLDCWFFIG